jgi:hypothetical protein
MLPLDDPGGVEPGVVVVAPVLVAGFVPASGLDADPVIVVCAADPADPVLGVVDAPAVFSVPVAVSDPQPSNASAMTAQTLTLRRGVGRDMEPLVWPLSVESFRSKIMSASKDR